MKEGLLQRTFYSDQGTLGKLSSMSSGKSWFSLELPQRNDRPNFSCVDPGIYKVGLLPSPHFNGKLMFHLVAFMTGRDVAGNPIWGPIPGGRTYLMIHNGNLAGDVLKGYISQVDGCILVGENYATFPADVPPAGKLPQIGVTNSVEALAEVMAEFGTEDWILTIQ